MFKMVCGILMTSAMAMIAVNAMAQEFPKGGTWWLEGPAVKALKLTGDEIEKLDHKFGSIQLNMMIGKSNIESEKRDLKKLMASPKRNEAAIKKHTDKLEKLQSAMAESEKEKKEFPNFVRDLLGPARFQKLLDLNLNE
jgi:Spy/CpxP family protein refolding chaperone